MPLGLLAFRYSDPQLVRVAAGAIVLGFAALLALSRGAARPAKLLKTSHNRDLAAGAVSGAATALVGMAGPPVLIYLLLAGAASQVIRATLLAFFALVYAATLAAHAATIGVPVHTWLTSGILLPFAFLGGLIGRPLGDRLGADAFTVLAIGLLIVAGLFTLAAGKRLLQQRALKPRQYFLVALQHLLMTPARPQSIFAARCSISRKRCRFRKEGAGIRRALLPTTLFTPR